MTNLKMKRKDHVNVENLQYCMSNIYQRVKLFSVSANVLSLQ